MQRTLTLLFLLLLILVFPISSTYGQQSEPEGEAPDTAQKRAEWFARERGVEPGRVPSGLRAKALRDLERMRGDEKRRGAAAASGAISPAAVNAVSSTSWNPIGPSVLVDSNGSKFSGRISALAVDPRNPLVVYAGAADGGVWKTTDGGQSWTPLTDTQASLSIGSIALDPSAPDTVYVGTGEFNGGDAYPGVGILKSTDGGATWTNIQTPFIPKSNIGLRIPAVAVSPTNSQILLAAVFSSGLPQGTEGLFRSTDGGNTWSNVFSAYWGGTSVVFDPQNGSVAYAGIEDTNGSQPTVKLLKSTDAGATWSAMGLAETLGVRMITTVAPTDSSLYVAYSAVTADRAFLFRSRDGGASFTELNDSQLCGAQCGYNIAMAVNPINPNELFFGGINILDTTDGGSTWNFPFFSHADQHALSFSATGDRVYAGNDGGMWVATDLTRPVHFASINTNLATLQFYPGISIAPGNPSFGLGGTQDNGTGRYNGTSQWQQIFGADGFSTAIHPDSPGTFYLSTQNGNIWKTTDNGLTIQSVTNGLVGPATFNTVFTLDRLNPNRLYTVRNRTVFQTTDSGASWHAISPLLDLLSNSDIEVAPSDPNTVWATGCCGRIFVSRNVGAGATWTQFDGPTKRPLTAIAISPTDPSTAYVTVSGFAASFVGVDQVPGHVFKVTNGGGTWTDMTGNLPDIPMSGIVIDPAIPNTFYVATDIGVFVTSNAGASWDTAVTNLPRSAVMALALDAPTRTLRAATHGRSMFDLQLPAPPPPATCTPSSTAPNRSVTVCEPANAATVKSPFKVSAAAKDSATVEALQIYLDGVVVFEVGASSFDTTVTASSGAHRLTVKAWDAAGEFSQVLNITVSGGGSGTLTVSPSSLTFASQTVGSSSASQAVTLSNTTASAVAISSIAANGDFSQANNCGSSLAGGGSCTINVTFTPTAAGARSGTLTITDSAANSPQTVTLSGTGSTSGGGCTPSSTAPNRSVTICEPANAATVKSPFRVSAAVKDSATVEALQIYLDGVVVFEVGASSFDTTVTASSGTHRLTVKAWDAAGEFSQVLNITVSGSGSGTLTVSPSSLTFASQTVGSSSASQAVTLSNTTASAVAISSIAASGDFSQNNNCGSSLAGGGSCTINVTFTPTAAGTRSGTLTITDSAANSPQTVTLSGTGSTSGGSCTLSSVNPSVTICQPGDNATVSTPVHIVAGTTDSHTVVAIKIYVDGVVQFSTTSNSLDTSLPMAAGVHRITVKAWDDASPQQVFSQVIHITVP